MAEMVKKLAIENCCGKDLRPPTLPHQQPSQLHPFLSVEVQQSPRGSAFRRQSLYATVFSEMKVLLPPLLPGMKEGDDAVLALVFRVRRRDVGTLLEVTAQATQAQITLLIRTHVLLGDDMVNLMRKNGRSLRQLTVLTGVLRSTPYPSSPLLSHVHEAI